MPRHGHARHMIDQDNRQIGHTAEQDHGLLDHTWRRHGSQAQPVERMRDVRLQAGGREQAGIKALTAIQERLALGAARPINEPVHDDDRGSDDIGHGGHDALRGPGARVWRFDQLLDGMGEARRTVSGVRPCIVSCLPRALSSSAHLKASPGSLT